MATQASALHLPANSSGVVSRSWPRKIYRFEHSFSQDNSGATVLTFKLTQSHVSDGFLMLVPISIELGDGHVARLGRIAIEGNTNPEAAGAAAHSAA